MSAVGAATHKELVTSAARWLRNTSLYNIRVLRAEVGAATGEIPDVIGWNMQGETVLVECKRSRSDYHRDKRKPHKLGRHCYYFAERGVVPEDNLPPGWGLVTTGAAAGKHTIAVRAGMNPTREPMQEARILLAELERSGMAFGRTPVVGLRGHIEVPTRLFLESLRHPTGTGCFRFMDATPDTVTLVRTDYVLRTPYRAGELKEALAAMDGIGANSRVEDYSAGGVHRTGLQLLTDVDGETRTVCVYENESHEAQVDTMIAAARAWVTYGGDADE